MAMDEMNIDLRKTLSTNIKNQRELLGFSQEKLADTTGISVNMIRDIEGCRTWVSDTTLIKLALALKTDTYRLFMTTALYDEEIYKTITFEIAKLLQKTKTDINLDFEKALKLLNRKK
jgi:transcriptional regulator with XRE-family HTH domain